MRTTLFTLIIFCIGLCFFTCKNAGNTVKTDLANTPSNHLSIAELKSNLEAAHNKIFAMPVTHAEKMNIIQKGKAKHAPNFPKRVGATAEEEEELSNRLKAWISNYPEEYKTYMNYLNAQK